MAYQYLFEPEIQYQTKDGRNNTAGFLRVYLAATDDPATTYSDFGGTRNPQDIILDDDGRAVVIVDDSKAYRLEVYDSEGMLQFTCQPITAVGGGSGSANIVQVVSTDGTVSVTKTTAAGIITYDLSTAFEPEAARWARRTGTSESLVGDEDWHELDTFAEIGSTAYFNGWKLSKDCAYDLAASMEMPAGYDGAINTISVKFVVEKDGVLQDVQFGHVDPTTNMDRVSFEFKGAGLAGERINARLFYRTRQDMPIDLESEVFYNEEADSITGGGGLGDLTAGDYIEITEDHVINATGIQPEITWSYDNNTISAINGSAVGRRYDGIYPIVVDNNQNTVAVDHTGLAVDETMTAYNSADHIVIGVASGQFQPSGSYLSSNALDGISGAWNEVSAKLDSSASGQFYPSGNPSGFITGVDLAPYVTVSSISAQSSVWDTVTDKQPSGDYLSATESSNYYSTSNPSGFITGVDLSDYQLTADMSAYAHESSLSVKLDASASGEFYPSSNPSGFLTAHQSLAGYATEAYVDSSVSSKLDTTAFSTVSGDFLTSHQSLAGYATESYVDSAVSGKLDVTASSQFLTSLPDDLAYTSDVASAVSGKMDKSESSSFYPMDSNPSGYLTAHQSLAGYATETYVDSAVSGKLDATAYDSAEFYLTSNPSGFVDATSASAIASAYATGKQDVLTFGYDVDSAISSINGSALAGVGGVTGDYYEKSSTELAYGTAASASRSSFSLGKASADYLSIGIGGDILGSTIATVGSISLGSNSAKSYSIALGRKASATGYSIAVGDTARAKDNSFAFAWATASSLSVAMGLNVSAKNTAMVFGKNNLNGDGDVSTGHSAAFVIGDGTAANARHDLMLVTKDGEITMYSGTADTVGTGIMSSIRAISAAATGGGVDSATVSAIASSYAESAASSKQDTLTFDWDADSAISSINGSALAGGGAVTGDYVENSALDSASARSATGSVLPTVTGISSISGKPLIPTLLAQPTYQYGGQSKFIYMPASSMWTTADDATGVFSPLQYATGACLAMNAGSYFKSYYKGNEWFVTDSRYGMLRGEIHQSRGLRILASSTNSASGFELHPSGVKGVDKNGSAWQYGTSEYRNLTSVYGTVFVNSASWGGGGGGGIDSATCSAIASAYAESAASGKVDQSAYDELYSAFTALNDLVSQYSAYFSSISAKVDNSAIGVIE